MEIPKQLKSSSNISVVAKDSFSEFVEFDESKCLIDASSQVPLKTHLSDVTLTFNADLFPFIEML